MVIFDIETLPSNNEEVISRLAESIKPPAQYKKPESIEQWLAENKEKELNELVAKTSLNGAYGRVACIAWSTSDDDIVITTDTDASEEEAIQYFYNSISLSDKSVFCGHNIKGFDLQFLKHRSMILGIKPPASILRAMNCSIYDDCIADTMLMWTGDRNKYIGLDTLCWLFGIPGKGDFDGSMVADTWLTDPQKVIDYCADDVRRTRAVYNKLTFNEAVF